MLPFGSNLPQAPGGAMPMGMPMGLPTGTPMPQIPATPATGLPSLVGPLLSVDKNALTLELLNPNSKLDKHAVLAAINLKNQQEKVLQNAQGVNAQEQAAAMPPTVMAGVLQETGMNAPREPVMAAHGGAMRGYAGGGGIVAFSNGGMTDEEKAELMRLGISAETIDTAIKKGLKYKDLRRYAFSASQPVTSVIASPEEQVVPEEAPLAQRLARSESIGKALRMPEITPAAVAKGLITGGKPDFYSQEFEDPDTLMRELAGETRPLPKTPLPPDFVLPPARPDAAASSPPPVDSVAKRDATQKTRGGPPPVTPPAVTAPAQTGVPALLRTQIDEEIKRLEGKATTRPEELVRAEAEADRLRQARIDQQRQFGLEALREAQAQEQRARQAGEWSGKDIVALASGITGEKGALFKDLSKGYTGIETLKAERAEAARKEYALAVAANRERQAKIAEMEELAQRERIERMRGNIKEADDIRAQILGKRVELFKLEEEVKKAASEAEYKKVMSEAAAKQARAAETTAAKERPLTEIEEYRKDPALVERLLKLRAAASAEPKTEGAISKALITEMIKNPLRLQQLKELDPALYRIVTQEIAKLQGASGAATGTDFVFDPATGQIVPKQ